MENEHVTISYPGQVEISVNGQKIASSGPTVDVANCTHAELNTKIRPCEYIYTCKSCHKQVTIPLLFVTEHGQAGLNRVIVLAFGEQWKDHLPDVVRMVSDGN